MNQEHLKHLQLIINNLMLRELGPNHVHISGILTKNDMDLLQFIINSKKP